MYTIEITGFKTEEEARAFKAWYDGAGEQDSAEWAPEGANWYIGENGIQFKIKEKE